MHYHDELSDWLNGELPGEAGLAIARHLLDCAECAARAGELEAVRQIGRRTAPPPPAADAWPGIAREIRGRSGHRKDRTTSPETRPSSSPLWRTLAAAAVASAFLGGGLGVGLGAVNMVGGAAGAAANLDLRAVAGILAILVVLTPVLALAVRFSVPAVIRALREDPTPEAVAHLERELTLVADEVGNLTREQQRLSDAVAFDRRLGTSPPATEDPAPEHREDPS